MNALRAVIISVAVLLAGCGDRTPFAETDSERAYVVASNYPLYYFASRITRGVDAAPVIVLPDIDGDPAIWMPSAEQIQLLQSADIVFLNGAGAEPWLDLMTLDRRRLLDTSTSIADRLIPLKDSVLHQHGPEGEHSHQGTAFTTWLDPQLAIAQAEVLADALSELSPSAESQFRDNMATLKLDLIELDTRLAQALARFDGQPVLFSHPVYQYFERRYRINAESVHWEPDEEPSIAAWIEFQRLLTTHQATVMIWEDQPLDETEIRLSNAKIISVPFLTGANRPDVGDYLSVMYDNINRLDE